MAFKQKQTEQYWMEAFQNGEEKALAYFFKLHSKSLAYFTNRMVGDHAEADDIVSKCFLKLWQKHDNFKTAQNINAYIIYKFLRRELSDEEMKRAMEKLSPASRNSLIGKKLISGGR